MRAVVFTAFLQPGVRISVNEADRVSAPTADGCAHYHRMSI